MLKRVCDRCNNGAAVSEPVSEFNLALPKDWTHIHIMDEYDSNHPPHSSVKRDLCPACSKLHNAFFNYVPAPLPALKKTLDNAPREE